MLSHGPKKKSPSGSSRILNLLKNFELHASDYRRSIETFFECLDTPVSLSCYLLYKSGEFAQLVNKDISPANYSDSESFKRDYAAISFLRKHPGLKTGVDLRKVAISSFEDCEVACGQANARIRRYLLGNKTDCPNEWLLSAVIRKIGRILGDINIDNVIDSCGWGPGVTLSVKGDDTSGARKFDIDREITKDAYSLFGPVFSKAYPSWGAFLDPQFVMGNKIITVRKNAKTDRTIAVEPGLNSWIQKGFGKVIRRRLARAGYNLDSDLKNQRGAYTGSLDDSLATVDFKAASDSISIECVRLLLPPQWFSCLNAARSKLFALDGVTRKSEKFSTMGNGFTFELESLIFLSIGLAVCELVGADDSGVSIFGDDLVLPPSCIPEFTRFCTFLGFTLNDQKSFSSGPFRESCGQYYFNGVDVKPIFLKSDVRYAKDIFKLANSIRALGHRHALLRGCDRRFRRVWSLLVHFLPSELRAKGSVSSGDSCIHCNFSEAEPVPARDGWCGFLHAGFPSVAVSRTNDSHGLLLSRLHSPSRDRELLNSISLRGRTKTVFKKAMFVPQWYDFGDWL
jgi:hypothetical protein